MKRMMTLAMIALFTLCFAGAEFAEAKRFGMGSSFGKQRTVNKPAQQPYAQKQQSQQKQPTAANQRGSARTGMMGILGGLALGGLLGALFFGGAFEGVNLFDILIIGGIIFVVMMLMRSRRRPRQPSFGGAGYREEPNLNFPPSFDAGKEEPVQESFDFDESPREPVGEAVRPEIDSSHFSVIAKEIYIRMQKAWDAGDAEDIHRFCTPEIAERIGQDMSPNENHSTEVAMLNAEVSDSWTESDFEWVAVRFNGLLREQMRDHTGNMVEDQSAEVNETWIFRHDPNSDDPTWFVAGIQQGS